MFLGQPPRGEASLSGTSRADIEAFATRRRGHISTVEWIHVSLRDFFSAVWQLSNRGLSTPLSSNKVARKVMKGLRFLSIYLNKTYIKVWPFDESDDLLFIWALEKSGARYHAACSDRNTREEASDRMLNRSTGTADREASIMPSAPRDNPLFQVRQPGGESQGT